MPPRQPLPFNTVFDPVQFSKEFASMSAHSTLILHAEGKARGRLVQYDELAAVRVPEATRTWFPLAHTAVLDAVQETLTGAGYLVQKRQLALSRDNARFFGTLDLATEVGAGVALAVGVRNSIDQSYPIGFAAGNRVFICDNLAFSAELMIKRKHTRFGETRFVGDIGKAVTQLESFRKAEARKIDWLKDAQLNDGAAHDLVIGMLDKKVLAARLIPQVLAEYRRPRHEEFEARTRWSLYNAVTQVLTGGNVANGHAFAGATMRLNALLGPPEDEEVMDANFEVVTD
jgi:hypothetical protein